MIFAPAGVLERCLHFLSGLDLWTEVRGIYGGIRIPPAVFDEVIVRGREQGRPEIPSLERLLLDGFLTIAKPGGSLPILAGLHAGERDALSLSVAAKTNDVLVDDGPAVKAARALGLNPVRTSRLLVILRRSGKLTVEAYRTKLLALSGLGYYLSANVYEKLLQEV